MENKKNWGWDEIKKVEKSILREKKREKLPRVEKSRVWGTHEGG